jgi:hypothetical protein
VNCADTLAGPGRPKNLPTSERLHASTPSELGCAACQRSTTSATNQCLARQRAARQKLVVTVMPVAVMWLVQVRPSGAVNR